MMMKEGRNWVLCRFQQLKSYRDEIETRNREEIPYSSQIVPIKGSFCLLQKDHRQSSTTPHIYIATWPTRLGIQRRLEPANSRLGSFMMIVIEENGRLLRTYRTIPSSHEFRRNLVQRFLGPPSLEILKI